MGLYFWITLNLIASYCLVYSLYERIYAGKITFKTKQKKIPIIYTIMLVLCSCTVVIDLLYYFKGKEVYISLMMQGVFWIQMAISNLLGRLSLGIAKGGIYSGDLKSSYFTKWSRIKNYTWISDNVIEFETLTRKGNIFTTELEVVSEQKEEADKLLKDNLNKTDREVNENNSFKLKMFIALMAAVMIVVNVSLIKISKPYMTKKIKLQEDEAILILKKAWKPLAELNKENIKSREEFDKLFQETMTEPMIDNLYGILVDTAKSKDENIKFKEKVHISTIYDTKMSIEKSYIKTSKYKEQSKRGNAEELIIEELERSEDNKPLDHFKRKSTFIKNDNGNWVLDSITGLESTVSQ
ncbi:hypothetical protein [Clostridium peptidivorans]|uniref:hypothetical protein n=1 Tax=Clostridium peptidivorans TaxID=100174 RepID=UPI000BE31BD9|nr:hypothetical protein [Clostridium peptidivorans]